MAMPRALQMILNGFPLLLLIWVVLGATALLVISDEQARRNK